MPPRRKSHQLQQQFQRSPPPPYDGGRRNIAQSGELSIERGAVLVSPVFQQVGQQTIPKISEAQLGEESARRSESFEGGDDFQWSPQSNQQVSHNNQAGHIFQNGGRRRSVDQHRELADLATRGGGNNEFVNSLVASDSSFLRHITIEPFAFLAIMALYLEFPAIQDLIYTKICLEVVANHPNMLSQLQIGNTQFGNSSGYATNSTNLFNATLPSKGRIQEISDSISHDSQVMPDNSASRNQTLPTPHANLHNICDRLNKTAVPLEVRQEIRKIDSLFWLKYQILICLLCALSSPYWGGVSDKIGRLLPLNVPIFASILCNSISLAFGLLISVDSHALIHINWLYVGAVMVGLSGGQAVLIMNSFGFISDNTTSEQRSKRVIVLESVIVVAHSVGYLLSKLIMPLGLAGPNQLWLNRHFVSFGACVLINLLCIIYSSCRLRHHKFHKFLNNFEREQQEVASSGIDNLAASASATSLEVHRNGASSMAFGNPTGGSCDRLRELTSSTPDDPDGPIARSDQSNWSVRDTLITFSYYKQTYQIATKPRETRTTILLLLLLGFISALSLATLMSLLFIYVKMDPFNWSTSQYSSWNANSSITRGLALIGLTLLMKFVPSWQVSDVLVAAMGFVAKGAGLLMIGLAQSTALINWSLVAFAFFEFSMPPIRSLLSKLVPKEELGKIYSCLGALQSLCFILGNLAFYLAFTSFVQRDLFKFTFITVGAIEIGALLLVIPIYSATKRQILIT